MLLFCSLVYPGEDPVESQYQKGITKKANDYSYSARYPASNINGDLPFLELESYIKDGTLSSRKQDADFQQLCDNLFEKRLSHSRLTRNASHYNMALSYGLKVCEETGRKEHFLEILEKEKTGIPRDMAWMLMEKTRQAKGEIAPVTPKPQTPHELLNYPGKMDKMRQP
jgi:hypothetical protein